MQSSAFTTRYILTETVSSNLFPFDLLPGDWKLPSQPLKRAFCHPAERPVEFLLVCSFGGSDAADHSVG
jgi:hypothetical protein